MRSPHRDQNEAGFEVAIRFLTLMLNSPTKVRLKSQKMVTFQISLFFAHARCAFNGKLTAENVVQC